jgi:IS5 family transposase
MASGPSGTRVEAIVLRTLGPQGSLFELLLPAGMRVLSGELAEVDALLDDARFFGPFRPFFSATGGRPSVPIETYLLLMFLKCRTGLGYGRLLVEVGDSLSWRRFCRIGLEVAVPDESTIRKITRRCGPELVEALNQELLVAAGKAGVVSLQRLRADSTVVEADVSYPTDSGLLTKAVAALAKLLGRLQAAGVAVSFVDRTSEARSLQHSIAVWLRRRSEQAKAEVLAITGQIADLAVLSVAEAAPLEGRSELPGRVGALLRELKVLLERTRRIIGQARVRVDGATPPGASRLVSLHDPDARPISKGRLGKPVEFGYKAQVVDNADGLIVDHSVHIGNPSDTDLARPALSRINAKLAGAVGVFTADRGYWDSSIETDLKSAGVGMVVIPRTGKPSAARAEIERSAEFVEAVKWRTGCEGRISCLKRDFMWRRSRLRGHDGARIWCGHSVFAHNLVKLICLQR